MSKLVWDEAGKRFYETGVKQAVLYTKGEDGAYAISDNDFGRIDTLIIQY